MATMDLVRKLRNLSESGWDLNDVLFLLEDEYIEVQEEEIDKVKCEVVEFLKACVTQRGDGYPYLCYVITILVKEEKSYWEALEEASRKFWCQQSDMRKAMRWTIRQMAFDPDMHYFDGINFGDGNIRLDEEFVEEAVDHIKWRIG